MPRRPRLVLTGVPHHVVARGVNRQPIFHTKLDKSRYLKLLARIAIEEDVAIHGYTLMRNHVHLLLTPRKPRALAKLFQRMHTSWAMYLNRTYQRTGHVFQNRYYSSAVGESHYWTTLRYIELNPRKAGWNGALDHWLYSSARAHLTGVQDLIVKLDWEAWQIRYGPANWQEFLSHKAVSNDDIFRQALAGCRPVGDATWIAGLERTTGRKLTWSPPGRPSSNPTLLLAAAGSQSVQ